ncbi:uncharacterized protein LOC142494352 [Ascaphus truei]|uniref:uncharacterized protein LOC142494352 n=1 Tax=Ascaphus truei TaxID=8439 RepID=UPI003F5AA161
MDQKIQRQFVEDRAAVLDFLPVTWNVKRPGPYYCLTMKMSRLKDLAFGFEFGSVNPRETFPVTGFPERIVKLDVSLNELEELQADSLLPFENLLELDVSLNALGSVHAVGALPSLAVLNASYNAMTHIKGLATCSHLITLNVSHNHVRSMKDLPMLASLNQLHLDSNELESLEGIQNLPQLYELYVQNNQISSLLPLSTSLSLNVLDASNNDLGSLPETLQVVCGLRRLTQLKLKGNSLARDSRYATAIKQNTTVQILDNSLLKDPTDIGLSPKQRSLLKDFLGSSPEGGPTRQGLKDVAQKSFMGKLQAKRKDVESAVHHLHGRIMDLREELKDYEDNLSGEMESYVRYIDVIPPEHFHSIDPQKVPQAMEKYLFTKFWERWEHGKRKPGNVPFKDLTKPEEVVKAAAWLFSNPPMGTSSDS